MTKHFTPPNLQKHVCRKGSALLVMVIVLAIISSMIGISVAKIGQASMSATTSNKIALQASNIAASDAALLHSVSYEDLTASNRNTVPDTDFQHETLLSSESNYTDSIKQRTATINVYKGSETTPRASLKVTRYSVEKQESSGVPVGTVIAWPGTKAPTTAGTWLECNGQSCAAYPELVAVLGKNTVPDYRNRFLESSTTAGIVKEAGLPNIIGKVYSTDFGVMGIKASGAFKPQYGLNNHGYRNSDNRNTTGLFDFDASRSNAIYGKSNTVQPASVTVRRFIKAA